MNDEHIEFRPWVEPGFWTCARGTPTSALAAAFAIDPKDCIELSAREWTHEDVLFDDLARAFSFPDYFGRNWHAAGDCLSDVREARPRYLVVLRDIPEAGPARDLALEAADLIGTEDPNVRARCVVLEGWPAGVIEPVWDRRRAPIPVRAV